LRACVAVVFNQCLHKAMLKGVIPTKVGGGKSQSVTERNNNKAYGTPGEFVSVGH